VMLETAGVHVPRVFEWDIERGLLLLEDLGTRPYLPALKTDGDADLLYRDALQALANIQVRGRDSVSQLPPYDRAVLVREMALMPEWFCARHLQLELTREQGEMLTAAFEFLVAEALAQPQVFVHRDYHSRNLLITSKRNPGIIDFQDALRGPVGYDLASLLKDCYISWPRARLEGWVREYRLMMHERASHSAGENDAQMLHWVDVIGIQRHLKVLGIFARLWYRDGKPGYLNDLPLTLSYVVDACARFPALQPLREFLLRHVVPALPGANAREAQRVVAPA
jgi:N-acetylmuramate 1-kinase